VVQPQASNGSDSEERFAASYVRLCQKQGRPIVLGLEARTGDWVVGPKGLRLVTEGHDKAGDELVVPDLDRMLALLRQEAPGVVIDFQEGDVGLSVWDAEGRALANIVSKNAPEACMRALLFVLTERKANELSSATIQLKPVSRG
jgi:hypothetical protein